jgi:hypothetical protein
MFASIRTYNGIGDVAAIRRGARKDLYSLLRKQAGFVSYSLIDTGDGSLTISVFNTLKQAEAANIAVRDLVQQAFKELLPTPPAVVVVGEVVGHLAK